VARALFMLLSLSILYGAEERVTVFRSGPFEVYAQAGDKAGREVLNRLEQFRHVFGAVLGKDDLHAIWPVRITVVKPAKGQTLPGDITLKRDIYLATVEAGTPFSRFFYIDLAKIFLNANAGPLTDSLDNGLLTLYSTIQINGTRVTLGALPPAAERTRDWARMHMLSVSPEYSGKLRVLLANLQRGVEPEPAYRNAFEKTPAEIEKQLDAYMQAGQYGTTQLSGKPISPERDFKAGLPEPVVPGAKSALDLLEARDFKGAAALNPRWAEPVFQMAEWETDPPAKAELLKKAIALEPRNKIYRAALAAALSSNKRAIDDAKRYKEEQSRLELERLREEALRRIRLAEMKANEGKVPVDPSKVQEWWDPDKASGQVKGTLQRIDCISGMARLHILPPGAKPVQLLVRDPRKIVLQGGGVTTLGCGVQKPAPSVTVQYVPKPDSKMGTAGDAALVEFQ
jgi:hypothetical protein